MLREVGESTMLVGVAVDVEVEVFPEAILEREPKTASTWRVPRYATSWNW
jgi:hypothetical protein